MAKYGFEVGSQVEVTTSSGEVLKGEVFAFDKYSYTLVLKELSPSETLRIIKADIIKSPGGVKETKKALPGAADVQLPAVDPTRSLKKEAEAVKAAEVAAKRIGEGVTKEGQAIFDAISKTMPVEWQDKTIIVLGEVKISEPYTADDAVCGPDSSTTLSRVKLVIEAERAKFGGEGQ